MSRSNVLALISAILGSGTNALALVLAAILLQPPDYGAFAFSLMLIILFSTLINAPSGEVLLSTRHSVAELRDAQAFLNLASALGCLALGLASLLIWRYTSNNVWSLIMGIAAIALPGACMHLLARSTAFALGNYKRTVLLEGVRLTVLLAAIAALIVADSISLATFGVAFAIASYVATVSTFGWAPLRQWRPKRAVSWTHRHGKFGVSLAGGVLAGQGSSSAVSAAVGAGIGLVGVGGLRFAQTIFGLSSVFYSAARHRVLPRLAQGAVAESNVKRFLFKVSALLTLVPVAALSVILLAAPILGKVFPEQTWAAVDRVLIPIAVMSLASAARQGAMMGLRLLRRAKAILLCHVMTGFATVVTGIGGMYIAGLPGAAWGMAVGAILGSVAWWVSYVAIDQRERTYSPGRDT